MAVNSIIVQPCANAGQSMPTFTHVFASVNGSAFTEIAGSPKPYQETGTGLEFAHTVNIGDHCVYKAQFQNADGTGLISDPTPEVIDMRPAPSKAALTASQFSA